MKNKLKFYIKKYKDKNVAITLKSSKIKNLNYWIIDIKKIAKLRKIGLADLGYFWFTTNAFYLNKIKKNSIKIVKTFLKIWNW